MTWTKKHDEFCLSQNLRPSTTIMLRWILRRANATKVDEIEIDLRLFNNWIALKRGRGFDRKTIREAIEQLDEKTSGLILVTKNYSPWIKKLLVRPLSMVLEMQSKKLGKSPQLKRGNPMFSETFKNESSKQQQQIISKLDSLFTQVGIKFDHAALRRVWKLSGKSLSSITSSIELLLHRHSTQTEAIRNPQGFIIECLKHYWHEGFNLFYQPNLPQFSSARDIHTFVKSAMSTVQLGQLTVQTG